AEDGIRDFHVTGVQTCALPIFNGKSGAMEVLLSTPENAQKTVEMLERTNQLLARMDHVVQRADQQVFDANGVMPQVRATVETLRSEERRVGEECRNTRSSSGYE